MKTPEQCFIDWESEVFGYGYGSGEMYTLQVLKDFFSCIKDDSYDYKTLEKKMGGEVTWLLLSALHKTPGFLNYGTSTRFAWLEEGGKRVMKFVNGKTTEELYDIVMSRDESYAGCGLNYCNCNPPESFSKRCPNNPFFDPN